MVSPATQLKLPPSSAWPLGPTRTSCHLVAEAVKASSGSRRRRCKSPPPPVVVIVVVAAVGVRRAIQDRQILDEAVELIDTLE